MATRCLIGLVDSNTGHCKTIYCHNDGYLEYTGEILKKYYKYLNNVEQLLALGDLSLLGPIPKSDPKMWDSHFDHYHINPYDKYCIAYKDRGEKDIEAREYDSISEAIKDRPQSYHYFYIDGEWYCKTYDGNIIELKTGNIIKKE